MEEGTFSGVKVDEILADFFVRKYDGKLEKSPNTSVSSNHSSSGIKENSKKSKKKKKKHRSKKSRQKYSNKRYSRSPQCSEKHQSRSSDSCERDRSKSPKHSRRHRSQTSESRNHRSRSPRHSRRHQYNSSCYDDKYRSRSPRYSSKHRSSSTSHSDRSRSPGHSRKSRSRSTSHSSRSPRHKKSCISLEHKSAGKSQDKGTDNASESRKGERDEIKDEKHSKQKTCLQEKDPKSVIPEHCKSESSFEKVDNESLNFLSSDGGGTSTEVHYGCSLPKFGNYVATNAANTHNFVGCENEDSSTSIEAPTNGKCVVKPLKSGLSDDQKKSQDNVEMNCSNITGDTTVELGKFPCEVNQQSASCRTESNCNQIVLGKSMTSIIKSLSTKDATDDDNDARTAFQGDVDIDNSKSNVDDLGQAKSKIVIKDLKCSSVVKTLYNCDNIELPPDSKSSMSSGNVSESVNNDDESEGERSKELSSADKKDRSPSESSGKSSDSDQRNGPQEKKKRKHSKDKKHKRSKEKKHKKKKKTHSKERSISPRKSEGREKIDKVKLLNVARRNVLSMIEKGTLPQGISLENLRHEQLISIKAGGKSVQELTEFCQALSKKEGDNNGEDEGDDESNREDTKNDENSDQPFIHHPFKLKEQSVITMNIKNATQLPVKTHAEKVAENARLSLQFPVSSGSQHRQKEMEWVPVEKDKKLTSSTEKKVASKPLVKEVKKAVEIVMVTATETQAESFAPVTDTIKTAPLQTPVHLPPPPPSFPTSSLMPSSFPVPGQFLPCETNMAVSLPCISSHSSGQMLQTSAVENMSYGMSSNYMPTVPPPPVVNTFPALSAKNIDLSAVVADRLKAVRKLQENPHDPEGLSILQQSEQKLQAWVQSQQVPGKFTGSTDAKLLSARELSGPNPMWARKDSLARAAPVTGGKGMSLMKKMGWNPGEGLGKNKEGTLEPLVLDIKMDKKGLVSQGEEQKKKPTIAYCHKHPVSVLAELCAKRKWSPPIYTLLKEAGPSHKRLFLFKVNVNNIEYQAKDLSANKKLAKAQAAVLCLNAVGVTPSEYIMPS